MGSKMSINNSMILFNFSERKEKFDVQKCTDVIAKVAFHIFEKEEKKVTSFTSLGKPKQALADVA